MKSSKTRGHGTNLHEGLKKVGLRFEKKGSGAIIWVGETAIKSSSVDRSFSMGKLVKRLGEFVAGDYDTAMPKIEPEPLSQAIAQDLQVFRAATDELAKRKRKTPPKSGKNGRHFRHGKTGKAGKAGQHCQKHPVLVPIARYCLKIQQKDERKAFHDEQVEKRPSFIRPKFNQWLMRRGKNLAAILAKKRLKNQDTPPRPQPRKPLQSPQAKGVSGVRKRRSTPTAIG